MPLVSMGCPGIEAMSMRPKALLQENIKNKLGLFSS